MSELFEIGIAVYASTYSAAELARFPQTATATMRIESSKTMCEQWTKCKETQTYFQGQYNLRIHAHCSPQLDTPPIPIVILTLGLETCKSDM